MLDWEDRLIRRTGRTHPYKAALFLFNFNMLDAIDMSKWRQQILRRPPVATTADRKPGDDEESLVYFDWQQHWEAVRPLFERTDVRFAAAQGVQGRQTCKYCNIASLRSLDILVKGRKHPGRKIK
jgi:hypothetical protein